MPVLKIKFEQSPELVAEMDFFSQTDEGRQIYARFSSKDDIVPYVNNAHEYRDLRQFVRKVARGRVLDVGVGYGVTSAYLAIHGFDVVALEPSLRLCEDMERFFQRMGLAITVVQGIGEYMDALSGVFDAVVFNSSLHHCDDVARTLDNAYKLLRPAGRIFLFEPVLKFYRSQAWFTRMLKEDPGKVGHYGGNEHIYRFGEYRRFLKNAEFGEIVSFPSLSYQYSAARAPWDSDVRFFIKSVYFKILKVGVLRIKPVVKILTRLSLLNTAIFAKKPVSSNGASL